MYFTVLIGPPVAWQAVAKATRLRWVHTKCMYMHV